MTLRADALKPARNVGRPVVYILGTEDGTEVKIGYTAGVVSTRKNAHENVNGHTEPLRFLAAVCASQPSDERSIHRHFAEYRSRPRSREWFWASESIRGWIRALQGQPYTARSEAEIMTVDLVDPSYWHPAASTMRPTAVQLRLDADPWSDLIPDEVMEGDFYTDPIITDAARAAMGAIDLDPASCTFANRESVRASSFYGYRENGLLQDWNGRVWLNPPFGQWQEWGDKLIRELDLGRVLQACVLATSRASTTKAFAPIARRSKMLWIPDRRIPFFGPNATSSPDEGHFVYYVGLRLGDFHRSFSALGGEIYEKASLHD